LLNKKLRIIKTNYFFVSKKLKIYWITDFILRIEFIFFIKMPNYFEYFRLYKYNEYLHNHPDIQKYPLIFNILKIYNKKNWLRNNKKFYSFLGISNSFIIYGNNYYKKNINIIENQVYLKKIKLYLFKDNFIKQFFLYTPKLIKYLVNLFNQFLILFNNLYLYKLLINLYDKNNLIEIKKLKISCFLTLNKQLSKYNGDLDNWYKLKGFIEILNKILKRKFYYIPFYKEYINHKKLNQIWINTYNLIIIEYIEDLFFKFFTELNFFKKKVINKINKIWLYSWIILKKNYVFNWVNVSENQENISHSLKNEKYFLDFLIWRIFFISNIKFSSFFNLNLFFIINKIYIDCFLDFKKTKMYNYIIFFLFIIINNKQNYINIRDKSQSYLYLYNYKYIYNWFRIIFVTNNSNILYHNYLLNLNSRVNNFINYKISYNIYYYYKFNISLLIIFFSCYIWKVNLFFN
jgi:hypothetical protein